MNTCLHDDNPALTVGGLCGACERREYSVPAKPTDPPIYSPKRVLAMRNADTEIRRRTA